MFDTHNFKMLTEEQICNCKITKKDVIELLEKTNPMSMDIQRNSYYDTLLGLTPIFFFVTFYSSMNLHNIVLGQKIEFDSSRILGHENKVKHKEQLLTLVKLYDEEVSYYQFFKDEYHKNIYSNLHGIQIGFVGDEWIEYINNAGIVLRAEEIPEMQK